MASLPLALPLALAAILAVLAHGLTPIPAQRAAPESLALDSLDECWECSPDLDGTYLEDPEYDG
jgi:hypothetical protein